VEIPLLSAIHGRRDARLTVTFPAYPVARHQFVLFGDRVWTTYPGMHRTLGGREVEPATVKFSEGVMVARSERPRSGWRF